MFVSVGEAAKIWGVSASTMRKWDREGLYEADFRTKGNHRRYSLKRLLADREKTDDYEKCERENQQAPQPVVLGYARVSAHKQKNDLQRQIQALTHHANEHDWVLQQVYSDIASGMNDQRKGLLRLLRAVAIYRLLPSYAPLKTALPGLAGGL